MPYPILAPRDTWFTKNTNGITKNSITEIFIKNSYSPVNAVTAHWDGSEANDKSINIYVEGTKLTISGNGSGKIKANPDSTTLFSDIKMGKGFVKLNNIYGAVLLDTSDVTTFERAFQGDSLLENVDVSNWDVSNVKSIKAMFQGDMSLKKLDTSRWNLIKVTDISNFLNMGYENYNNKFLTEIDCSSWDTSNVTDAKRFATFLGNLSLLNITGWDLNNCLDISSAFYILPKLKSIDVSTLGLKKCLNIGRAFQGDSLLENVDVSNWDVSNVTDMNRLFYGCYNLLTLDVSKWNTAKVKTFEKTFNLRGNFENPYPKINKLDVSNFNLSSCESVFAMFWGGGNYKEINVSKWNTNKIKTFDHFMANSYLRIKGEENLNISSATVTNAMFHSCQNEVINISKYDFSKVEDAGQLFDQCSNLKKIIGIENLVLANCLSFSEMFTYNISMEELNLTNLNTKKANYGQNIEGSINVSEVCRNIFKDMIKLHKITLGPNFAYNGDNTNTDLTYYATLPTPDPQYIPGADGNWYDLSGKAYTPAEAIKTVPNTYFASEPLMRNEPVMLKNGTLVDIGEGIRNKKADSLYRYPREMKAAIESIPTGADTSDATATANEVFSGKTAYIANGKTTGTFTIEQEIQNQNTEIAAIKESLKNKKAGKPEQEKDVTITKNGNSSIIPDKGKTLNKVNVTVNVPTAVEKKYELIEKITSTGPIGIARTEEPDGTPYNFSHMIVKASSTGGFGGYGHLILTTAHSLSVANRLAFITVSSGTKRVYVMVETKNGVVFSQGGTTNNYENGLFTVNGTIFADGFPRQNAPVTNLDTYLADIPADSKLDVEIWGIRA